ncbi:unnamed protein product [Amoebophrya sp. A25]|nr:unnamed protein product [Amoebophrya sp. A25]|eukprot:GSA25T00014031001.1
MVAAMSSSSSSLLVRCGGTTTASSSSTGARRCFSQHAGGALSRGISAANIGLSRGEPFSKRGTKTIFSSTRAATSSTSSSRTFSTQPLKIGYYIDGMERFGDGETIVSKNPATDEEIAIVHGNTVSETCEAVESAKEGFREWSGMTGVERSRIMHRAAHILKENRVDIANMETKDSGHCIAETTAAHVDAGVETLEYYANLAVSAHEGKTIPLADGSFAQCVREPYGPCAAIVAWNYPFNMALYKSAILLAAGNSIVMKPSSKTPINTMGLASLFSEAGLPPGVFNVVQGGADVGSALCEHPDVAKVSFTGSTPVGKKILTMAAHTIKPTTLELGGKSPLIIFDDADILPAVKAALIANFYSAGEICTNGTRVFVHEKVYDQFLSTFAEQAEALRVGDPLDPETQIGALVDVGHADSVRDYITKGQSEGATLVSGGIEVPKDLPRHLNPIAFIRPTIFADVGDEMVLAKEEIFGPVASVLKFSDTEEVLHRANATEFGLASGFFTKDLKRAHYVASKLQSGIVWCNTYNIYAPNVPVGGYKQSGFGREFGEEALEHATHTKSIYFEMNPDAGGTDF